MPPKKPVKPVAKKTVETIRHEEAKRKNIPTAEYQTVVQQEEQDPKRVSYARAGAVGLSDEKKTRNRDLDPQLVWRGKDQQDWSDLVVQAPPLYIQEKVHPKVLIDDLLKQTQQSQAKEAARGSMFDLFADFNGVPKGVDHITREPEQVKAFRDTWRDGIHSYLAYLRDRLTVARDLLTDSGSIFVRIGEQNVYALHAGGRDEVLAWRH